MDTSLVDSLKEQIEKGDVQLVRVTGPLGAGKSFATMQLACEEFVDFVDGGWLSGIGSHVFNELKLRIDERIGMKHALLQQTSTRHNRARGGRSIHEHLDSRIDHQATRTGIARPWCGGIRLPIGMLGTKVGIAARVAETQASSPCSRWDRK